MCMYVCVFVFSLFLQHLAALDAFCHYVFCQSINFFFIFLTIYLAILDIILLFFYFFSFTNVKYTNVMLCILFAFYAVLLFG